MMSSKHIFYCNYQGEGLVFSKLSRPSSGELRRSKNPMRACKRENLPLLPFSSSYSSYPIGKHGC